MFKTRTLLLVVSVVVGFAGFCAWGLKMTHADDTVPDISPIAAGKILCREKQWNAASTVTAAPEGGVYVVYRRFESMQICFTLDEPVEAKVPLNPSFVRKSGSNEVGWIYTVQIYHKNASKNVMDMEVLYLILRDDY